MEKPSILERLESFAMQGETSAPLKLWKAQITRLEKQGFTVHIISETDRDSEYYCDISWKSPTISNSDAECLLMFTINVLNKNISANKRANLPEQYKDTQNKDSSCDDSKYRSPFF